MATCTLLSDAMPKPFAFLAATVKQYFTAGVMPFHTRVVAAVDLVSAENWPSQNSSMETLYSVMGRPPVSLGAAQLMEIAEASLATIEATGLWVTCPGTAAGVVALALELHVPAPSLL